MTRPFGLSLVVFGSLFLGGCEFDRMAAGPDRSEPVAVALDKAERANIELDMGAGQMTIRGGSAKLLDGSFEYNIERWKPQVTSSANGNHATVTIKQPSGSAGGGKTHYTWDLRLNDTVLTDLAINCGAGQAQLDLGSLMLRSLEVHMGAGQVQLDLRGEPKHDYEVKINGGVGQATVHLPKSVGVWAAGHGGIGSVNVTGLEKRGDHWENSLYNKSKITVKVEVHGGIGEIRIDG